VTGRELLK